MKKIIIVILITTFIWGAVPVKGYCFLDWITQGISWVTGSLNKLWGGAKNAFGWGEQSKGWGQLMANYREGVQFYKGVEYLTKNPEAAAQDFYSQFMSEVTMPHKDLYSDVLDKSYEQKGYIKQAKDITFDYLKKNADFSKAILDSMDQNKKKIEKASVPAGKDSPVSAEDRNASLLKIIAELTLQNQALLAKTLEIENKRLALEAEAEGKRRVEAEKFMGDFQKSQKGVKDSLKWGK